MKKIKKEPFNTLYQRSAKELLKIMKKILDPVEDWEDQFYKFGKKYYFDWDGQPDKLENFIHSLLAQEKKKTVGEIREWAYENRFEEYRECVDSLLDFLSNLDKGK